MVVRASDQRRESRSPPRPGNPRPRRTARHARARPMEAQDRALNHQVAVPWKVREREVGSFPNLDCVYRATGPSGRGADISPTAARSGGCAPPLYRWKLVQFLGFRRSKGFRNVTTSALGRPACPSRASRTGDAGLTDRTLLRTPGARERAPVWFHLDPIVRNV